MVMAMMTVVKSDKNSPDQKRNSSNCQEYGKFVAVITTPQKHRSGSQRKYKGKHPKVKRFI